MLDGFHISTTTIIIHLASAHRHHKIVSRDERATFKCDPCGDAGSRLPNAPFGST
jgi:hypothetical protein